MSNYVRDRNIVREGFKNCSYESSFETFALEVYKFQYKYNPVYQHFCDLVMRTPDRIVSFDRIPYLPISFFKSYIIKTGAWEEEIIFQSSGTTGQVRSRHFIKDLGHYLENARKGFEDQFEHIREYCFIAVLPGYVERPDSSLILMVNDFISKSKYKSSGFYLEKEKELGDLLKYNKDHDIPTILFGVSFALLDLSSIRIDFPELIVIETGGMKNSKVEMEKEDIISVFKEAWNIKQVSSEYGMTELLSQSYALDSKWYKPAMTKRVIIGNLQDPFAMQVQGRSGILKIADLANFDTCSFIETQDLGVARENGDFQVLGRMDNAELRGCNLLLDDTLKNPVS